MRADADEHDRDGSSYPGGVPNFDKLGFLPIGVAGGRPMDHAEEAIRAVCERLDRPAHLVDAEGYERKITAGAVHPEKGWIAWVEYRCKERRPGYLDIEFRLKARVDGRQAIDWIVETYNPFFGCRVGYMAWHGERVVIIYREKHETYACSLSAIGGKQELVEIADDVDGRRGPDHLLQRRARSLRTPRSPGFASASPDHLDPGTGGGPAAARLRES